MRQKKNWELQQIMKQNQVKKLNSAHGIYW